MSDLKGVLFSQQACSLESWLFNWNRFTEQYEVFIFASGALKAQGKIDKVSVRRLGTAIFKKQYDAGAEVHTAN